METQLVSRHPKCISVVHKDHNTVFMLLKDQQEGQPYQQVQQPNQLKIVELDISTQTVRSSTSTLVFEGVQPHDSNYSLMYDCGFLILVYPTQMVCIYQDNGYFSKRSEDPECRGLEFYDGNLTNSNNDSARLALKHVVQSQLPIQAPFLQGTNLVFLSTKLDQASFGNSAGDPNQKVPDYSSLEGPVFLISLPLSEIDLLAQQSKQELFSFSHNRFAEERNIYVRRSPLLDLTSQVTDLIQVGNSSYVVSFSCGSLWLPNIKDSMSGALLGLAYMTDFMGQQVKSSCINTVDIVLVPWKESLSLHPSLFYEGKAKGPRAAEYLAFGDTAGNLVLYKNREPVFFDQVTYGNVASVKFLNVSLMFALMTSDGVLKVNRFSPLPRKQGDSNNLFEVVKLASVQTFEELNSQLRLRQIHLRGSQILQTRSRSTTLESQIGTLQVLWPDRVLMKVNNRGSKEDKFFAEFDLQILRLFPTFHPLVDRDYTPIVLSNELPMQLKDFVPQPDAETGQVEMHCERNCFLVDKVQVGGPGSRFQYWISAYDYALDKKQPLVNVSAESGVHDLDHFTVVRLDMRPAGLRVGHSDDNKVAKFLCTLQHCNGPNGVSGMCCSFTVDTVTGSLTQNVLQLQGKTGIYLGKLDYKDPSILVLQEDMKSLIIFSFDEGDLESKLPHGEVRLSSKVSGVYWTPLRDGLAVLYELTQDNLLTFSKNRLEKNKVKDFGVLVNRSIGLKLHYEERVFDVKWTGFSLGFAADERQSIRGVIATNQNIYFVDSRLQALGTLQLKHEQSITSLQWMGNHTVLATTRSHLMHVYCEKHPKAGVVMSLTEISDKNATPADTLMEAQDLPQMPIIVKALADRVIFASQTIGSETKFRSRPILMLEPILLGYLSSTAVGKADVASVQNCLKYLDTVAISHRLLQALSHHGMAKSVKFLLKNQPMLTSKVGLQPHQIIQIEDFADFIQSIFPQKDLINSEQDQVQVRKKLELDPACNFQKQLLQQRAEICYKKMQFKDAFMCADLLQDVDFQVKILDKTIDMNLGDPDLVQQFLRAAVAAEPYQAIQFDFKAKLVNRQSVEKVLKRVPERQMQKLMLAFDEVPLQYACPAGPQDGVEQENPDEQAYKSMPPMAFNSENFPTFIGVTKYVDAGFRNGAGGQGNDDSSEDQDHENNDMNESLDDQTDEVDERKYLKAYWRAEEGNGPQIADVSDKGIPLVAVKDNELVWHHEVNKDHEPLDYEDKWGKVNSANYAFLAPLSGLTIKKKSALISRSEKMTFEMWVKEAQPSEMLVLQILCEQDRLALFLIREQDRLICQLGNLQSKDPHQTQYLPESIDLSKWTHFAIVQKADSVALVVNFEQVAQFTGRTFGVKDAKASFNVLQAVASEGILVTELRLWQVDLSPKQLKNMAKQPLSILFEQKRNLNIQINKNKASKPRASKIDDKSSAAQNQDDAKDGELQEVKAPAKKKGGLKFTSKLDAKKESKPAVCKEPPFIEPEAPSPPISQDKQQVAQEQRESASPQVAAFAFDGFDLGPVAPKQEEKMILSNQSADVNNMFSFGAEFNNPSVAQADKADQAVAASSQPEMNFFSFDTNNFATSIAEPPANASDPSQTGKNDLLYGLPSVQPVTDLFSFSNAGSIPNSEQKPEKSSETFSFGQQQKEVEEVKEQHLMPPQAQVDQQIDLFAFSSNISQIIPAAEEKKQAQPLPEVSFQETVIETKAAVKIVEEEKLSFDEMMKLVEQHIAAAKLPEAAQMIQKALENCKSEARSVQSPDQKSLMKTRIRQSVVMKFTCDIALRISHIKSQVQAAESPFQKANLTSQIASLSNVLILLKLPDAMRANFFRFAIKQNQRIENYSALSKIASFWRKTPISDKDRQKIDEIETLCKARQNRNVQMYHGDDCPQCGANLAFGLATPLCHKCKAKIAVCYQSLKPILKDKQTLKCHVCLAQFSVYATQVKTMQCPYCQLVKLKLNVP